MGRILLASRFAGKSHGRKQLLDTDGRFRAVSRDYELLHVRGASNAAFRELLVAGTRAETLNLAPNRNVMRLGDELLLESAELPVDHAPRACPGHGTASGDKARVDVEEVECEKLFVGPRIGAQKKRVAEADELATGLATPTLSGDSATPKAIEDCRLNRNSKQKQMRPNAKVALGRIRRLYYQLETGL